MTTGRALPQGPTSAGISVATALTTNSETGPASSNPSRTMVPRTCTSPAPRADASAERRTAPREERLHRECEDGHEHGAQPGEGQGQQRISGGDPVAGLLDHVGEPGPEVEGTSGRQLERRAPQPAGLGEQLVGVRVGPPAPGRAGTTRSAIRCSSARRGRGPSPGQTRTEPVMVVRTPGSSCTVGLTRSPACAWRTRRRGRRRRRSPSPPGVPGPGGVCPRRGGRGGRPAGGGPRHRSGRARRRPAAAPPSTMRTIRSHARSMVSRRSAVSGWLPGTHTVLALDLTSQCGSPTSPCRGCGSASRTLRMAMSVAPRTVPRRSARTSPGRSRDVRGP